MKNSAENTPFWLKKTLSEMTQEEWESLCDGCGKCCTYKLEDDDTGEIFQTNVACRLLDHHTCSCKAYNVRHQFVPDCLTLKPHTVAKLHWLPETCGYRRVAAGKDLPEWHHLKTGDRISVHAAGASVKDTLVSELEVDDLEDHIIAVFKPE